MVLSVCGYQAYHDVSCATGRTQQQGGTADRASQTDEGVVSEEEFKGAEEWFREWRKRRSGSDTTSATATTGESTNSRTKGPSGTGSEAATGTPSEGADVAGSSGSTVTAESPRTPASSPADSTASSDTGSGDGGKAGEAAGCVSVLKVRSVLYRCDWKTSFLVSRVANCCRLHFSSAKGWVFAVLRHDAKAEVSK